MLRALPKSGPAVPKPSPWPWERSLSDSTRVQFSPSRSPEIFTHFSETDRIVSDHLLAYLKNRLALGRLDYSRRPAPVRTGMVTGLYSFQLRSDSKLPPWYARRLALRLYPSILDQPCIRHEFAVQRRLTELGYPVPHPVLLEENEAWFGRPFTIMEWLPGRTLLEHLLRHPWKILKAPAQMAEVHARLHSFPVDGFPDYPRSFLERRLEEMAAVIDAQGFDDLEAGLHWLLDNCPQPTEPPCILHLDLHPMNILFDGDRCVGVLDWAESDVGDRHADIANTLVFIDLEPADPPPLWDRLAIRAGRPILRWKYLNAYGKHLPIDERRLAYYRVWAAMHRLCAWGSWVKAGSRATGCKSSSLDYLESCFPALQTCCRQWAGVRVRL